MEDAHAMTRDRDAERVPARFGGGRRLAESERLTYALLPSPVGVLTLAASATGLRYILWENDELTRVPDGADVVDPAAHPVLAVAARQLTEYFAGERTDFDVPLEPQGTVFQLAAWQALRTIPYGQTVSYGEQARRLGDVNKSRAVGAANGRNPLSIIVPCHRVVGSDGSLTGFGGGIEAKAWLLAHESDSPTLW
jgi:methylated-DNA-[protein]-cysteine S-methyltransferase